MKKANEQTVYCGIDVSCATFDAVVSHRHRQFPNTRKGFAQLLRWAGAATHFVMEATGPYHSLLAHYLYEQGKLVSVLNPREVHRFLLWKGKGRKTDKLDAALLAEFAQFDVLPTWRPMAVQVQYIRQLNKQIAVLNKEINRLTNQLHAHQYQAHAFKQVGESIKRCIAALKTEKQELEETLRQLVQQHYGPAYVLLLSIPGVAPKTAAAWIGYLQELDRFETSAQLVRYLGLDSQIKQSVSSVVGKGNISKRGNANLRAQLFMCALSAAKWNTACKELYQRLIGRGKPKKVALIAVVNKLVRQIFAILKAGEPYVKQPKIILS